MAAQLILPDVHHVTGGEPEPHTLCPNVEIPDCNIVDGACQGCGETLPRTPRSWWWPVDQFDYVCAKCRGSFSLPLGVTCADHNPQPVPAFHLQQLTEPCDTCDGAGTELKRRFNGGNPKMFPSDCPDCHDGKRIAQLIQTCPGDDPHGWWQSSALSGDGKLWHPCPYSCDRGMVTVARVTITLLPVVHPDEVDEHEASYHGPECVVAWPNGKGGTYQPEWDGALEIDDCVELPFKVEPSQWVARAEERSR